MVWKSCLYFTSCSFSCSTRTISPGSTPGAWSASPENVIFCPCLMPLSTCTSRSFVSLHTLWPSHFLQRSFSFITSPAPANKHRFCHFPQYLPFFMYLDSNGRYLWTRNTDITLSIAICADWLHLLNHPWGKLSNHDSHTPSSACDTLLHRSCFTALTKRRKTKILNRTLNE